jgi:hypothetical protein
MLQFILRPLHAPWRVRGQSSDSHSKSSSYGWNCMIQGMLGRVRLGTCFLSLLSQPAFSALSISSVGRDNINSQLVRESSKLSAIALNFVQD